MGSSQGEGKSYGKTCYYLGPKRRQDGNQPKWTIGRGREESEKRGGKIRDTREILEGKGCHLNP